MGTWGTGISSNDVYVDINYAFFEFYNQGLEVTEITERLIADNKDLVNSYEEQNNFWITIAKAQWECKALDPKILDRVKNIVESGKDIALWKELDAGQSDLTKREKVLAAFLAKIQTEKKSVRKRVKKRYRDAIYEKGDCLIFQLSDKDYCGAFVLESEKNTEFGLNLIVLTDIKSKNKPSATDFENANVHFSMEQQITKAFKPVAQIFWYHASLHKKSQTKFEVVGRLKVSKSFDANKDYPRFSSWDNMPHFLDTYYSDLENNNCNVKLKLKKLKKKYLF
ncbi:hypothetical protein WIW50_12045 [Flavobacteriaceae bacterium 3-367]|uniref:hypothetical protein n=1 Tax=Eudoraea algarum TaxID=3417568 RepID=UPI0032956C66